MSASSIAAVKRVVDTSLGSMTEALVMESEELTRLLISEGHRSPMMRFLKAGGQTREAERDTFAGLMKEMLGS